MNEYYRQGFIDKCAEMGVDPEHLCKLAARGDAGDRYYSQIHRLNHAVGDSVNASGTEDEKRLASTLISDRPGKVGPGARATRGGYDQRAEASMIGIGRRFMGGKTHELAAQIAARLKK